MRSGEAETGLLAARAGMTPAVVLRENVVAEGGIVVQEGEAAVAIPRGSVGRVAGRQGFAAPTVPPSSLTARNARETASARVRWRRKGRRSSFARLESRMPCPSGLKPWATSRSWLQAQSPMPPSLAFGCRLHESSRIAWFWDRSRSGLPWWLSKRRGSTQDRRDFGPRYGSKGHSSIWAEA